MAKAEKKSSGPHSGKDDSPRAQGKKGSDPAFGVEGTNKTLPQPQDEAQPSAELQGTKSKYIPDTPYTRG